MAWREGEPASERYRPCLSRVGAIRQLRPWYYLLQEGDPSDTSISESRPRQRRFASRLVDVVHPHRLLASLSLQCQCSCPLSGALRYPLCTRVPQLGGAFLLDVVKRQYKTRKERTRKVEGNLFLGAAGAEGRSAPAAAAAGRCIVGTHCCYRRSSLNLKWDNGQRVVRSFDTTTED